MNSRSRPPQQPSLAPRRITFEDGAPRLVVDELIPSVERPLQVELLRLERFSALMAAQGWPAHVSRMAYDRIYAGERFAFAKRVGWGELPELARQLLACWRVGQRA